ncbi:putative G3BP-like protein isoform X1 [Tanacetum coccineum]
MTSPYHLPVITASQVGTFFVGNYYQVLQAQPDFVHQFYNDTSTLLRVDGVNRQTASSMLYDRFLSSILLVVLLVIDIVGLMLFMAFEATITEFFDRVLSVDLHLDDFVHQIHALVMSLNYTGIEIKTVHALDSWDRGVLVLVSGSVHLKDFASRRNFVQTFFLAPQETGYFVLNDIFQFVDDQTILHHPVAFMTQNDLVSKLNGATAVREQASSYMSADDIQARDYVPPTTAEENGTVNNYTFQEQQDPVTENIHEDNYAMQTNGSVQNPVSALNNHSTPVEEVVGEPQKHTYASILQVAKGHPAPLAPREQTLKKSAVPSDSNHVSKPPSRQSRSGAEIANDTSVVEDEDRGGVQEVGRIMPERVAIRTERYEDITGVNNAIKEGRGRGHHTGLKRSVWEVETITIATEAMIVITHDQEATATIVKLGHIPTPTRLLKMVMYHQIEDHEGLKVPLVTSIIVLEESNLMNQ